MPGRGLHTTSSLNKFPDLPRDLELTPLQQSPPEPLLCFVASHNFLPVNATTKTTNVFKMGRTTGPTAGVANGCRAVTRVYKSGKLSGTSTECVLLPNPSIEALECFALSGDSGALVYDGVGKPHSMIWGGVRQKHPATQAFNDLGGVIFATPIDAVLRSINAALAEMHPGEQLEAVLV